MPSAAGRFLENPRNRPFFVFATRHYPGRPAVVKVAIRNSTRRKIRPRDLAHRAIRREAFGLWKL